MTSDNNHIEPEIKRLLDEVAEDHHLKNYSIKTNAGSLKGDGYVGLIATVQLSNEKDVINLVVKSATKDEPLRKEAHIADLFQREIYMYDVVIPLFQKLQVDHSLLPISSFPEFYRATLVRKSEALILEDLKVKGFKLWERHVPMDEDHVQLVLKEFAHFHALSLALRDQDAGTFHRLVKPIDDNYLKFFGGSKNLYADLCHIALGTLCPSKDAEAYRTFKRFSDGAMEFLLNLPDLVDEYSVIIHGDGWTNNIMFSYDDPENLNKPTKLRLIDLALARMGPPVLDISFFFYICSSKDIITNFWQYLHIYYDALADNLRKLKSDPDVVYPYSVFCRQWKESARFGLLKAMLLYRIMLTGDDEVPDLAAAVNSGKNFMEGFIYNIAKIDEYNDRVKHLILHFVKNKFL